MNYACISKQITVHNVIFKNSWKTVVSKENFDSPIIEMQLEIEGMSKCRTSHAPNSQSQVLMHF